MKPAIYTIKDIEHLTGIKAHTIRIWEQRYGVLCPHRTDSNIRYYDADDLKKMLNIALLNQHGYKISSIAQMSKQEICCIAKEIVEKSKDNQVHINALTTAMIDFDEEKFEKIISVCTIQMGFEKAMIEIITPLLVRTGVLWATDSISPAQEHFISNLVRQKLIVAIDGQPLYPQISSKRYMLYLPPDEMHELGLLFSNFIIRKRNHRVIYLGQNMPILHLKQAFDAHKPDFILTFLTSWSCTQYGVEEYLCKLGNTFPDTQILVSGAQVIGHYLRIPQNIKILNKVQDLIVFVEEQ